MAHAKVNGISIHYRFDGPDSGPLVMLSNSLASNLAMWDSQVPALTAAGYRVLRYDSRGHGHSDAPEGPYTIEMLADDAAGLMDAVGIKGPVHFGGLSKGGMVSMMLGTRHANRVRSLFIADSACYVAAKDTWDQRIQTVTANGMAAVVDATVDRWFIKPNQARLPNEVKAVRGMILSTPVAGFVGCCRAIQAMDQRESIKAITVPAHVAVGRDDQGTPVEASLAIYNAMPTAGLTVIPAAAHFANVEQPEIFNGVLLGFLAKHN